MLWPFSMYALRDRRHDFLLPCRISSLTDSNFIIRQLFKDSYWLVVPLFSNSCFNFLSFLLFYFVHVRSLRFVRHLNKRIHTCPFMCLSYLWSAAKLHMSDFSLRPCCFITPVFSHQSSYEVLTDSPLLGVLNAGRIWPLSMDWDETRLPFPIVPCLPVPEALFRLITDTARV